MISKKLIRTKTAQGLYVWIDIEKDFQINMQEALADYTKLDDFNKHKTEANDRINVLVSSLMNLPDNYYERKQGVNLVSGGVYLTSGGNAIGINSDVPGVSISQNDLKNITTYYPDRIWKREHDDMYQLTESLSFEFPTKSGTIAVTDDIPEKSVEVFKVTNYTALDLDDGSSVNVHLIDRETCIAIGKLVSTKTVIVYGRLMSNTESQLLISIENGPYTKKLHFLKGVYGKVFLITYDYSSSSVVYTAKHILSAEDLNDYVKSSELSKYAKTADVNDVKTALEAEIAETKNEILGSDELTETFDILQKIQQWIDESDTDIIEMLGNIASNTSRISVCEGSLTGHGDRISSLEEQAKKIPDIEDNVTKCTNDITNLSDYVDDELVKKYDRVDNIILGDEGVTLDNTTVVKKNGILVNSNLVTYPDEAGKLVVDKDLADYVKTSTLNDYTTKTEVKTVEEALNIKIDNTKKEILGENLAETYDTLKEISDWIVTHGNQVTGLTTAIQSNTTNINKIEENIETIEDRIDDRYVVQDDIKIEDDTISIKDTLDDDVLGVLNYEVQAGKLNLIDNTNYRGFSVTVANQGSSSEQTIYGHRSIKLKTPGNNTEEYSFGDGNENNIVRNKDLPHLYEHWAWVTYIGLSGANFIRISYIDDQETISKENVLKAIPYGSIKIGVQGTNVSWCFRGQKDSINEDKLSPTGDGTYYDIEISNVNPQITRQII